MISRVGGIENPGRMYRSLFCEACESIRIHAVDFIEAERNERGIFAWYKSRCTGIDPGHHKNEHFYRRQKKCNRETIADLPATQWKALVENHYY